MNAAPVEERQIEFNNPDGYAVMKSKKDRATENFCEASGKRAKKMGPKVIVR